MDLADLTDAQLDELVNDRWAAHYAAQASLHNAMREGNEAAIQHFRNQKGQIDLSIDIIISEIERRKR